MDLWLLQGFFLFWIFTFNRCTLLQIAQRLGQLIKNDLVVNIKPTEEKSTKIKKCLMLKFLIIPIRRVGRLYCRLLARWVVPWTSFKYWTYDWWFVQYCPLWPKRYQIPAQAWVLSWPWRWRRGSAFHFAPQWSRLSSSSFKVGPHFWQPDVWAGKVRSLVESNFCIGYSNIPTTRS